GLLTRVTDPHGLTRTFTYSGGLVATVSEPDGGLGTFSYSSGKLTTIQEPGGRTLTITYGLSNQVSGLPVPDGGLKTFTYDGSFRPTNFQWDLLNASFTYDATTGSARGVIESLGTLTNLTAPVVGQGLLTSPARNASAAVAVVTDA